MEGTCVREAREGVGRKEGAARLPRMDPRVFRHRLRIRYGECDAQGVVFNANYLAYFDVVLTEFWREALVPYGEMLDHGVDMVVAESRLRFLAPAAFDELLDFELRVARL